MMTGKTTIDGLDLYDTYGVYITYGGYNSLVSYPPLKAVPFNDWPEENGKEVDLTNPVLDTKAFSISFAVASGGNARNFFLSLTDGAYHTFDFTEIGYNSVILRMIGQQNLKLSPQGDQFLFSLTFSDDFPLRSYLYLSPNLGAETIESDYIIDGINLSAYGIRVLQGSAAEILKLPEIKQKLSRKYADQPGILNGLGANLYTFDTQDIVTQTKEVTLNLLLTTDTLVKFWRNYRSFLYDLKRPYERYMYVLEINPLGDSCFYKKSTVNQFLVGGGKVWCQFSLTLEFPNFKIDMYN